MGKLIFPQEIEVWHILPAIRKKIALKLVEKGLSQKKVAEMMGVTPAAISQYKKQKRAKEEIFDQEMEKELEKSIIKIIKNDETLAEEIIRLNNLIKRKGIVCKIYKEVCALKNNQGNCPYCNKDKANKNKLKNNLTKQLNKTTPRITNKLKNKNKNCEVKD